MKLTMYQVDAFAERVFEGNPAAVCPLEYWLDDTLLQAIAEENNLSETAFFVPAGEAFELRWFTPAEEVDLCGHATLATAHVIYTHLGYSKPALQFLTRSGVLTVTQQEHGLCMDFPAAMPVATGGPSALLAGLGGAPKTVLAAFDYVVVYDSEEDVRALTPDFVQLETLGLRGVVATAPGQEVDFVSRCFFPKLRVNEDPVTGSAHCELAPYWSQLLGRKALTARQLSKRGGSVACVIKGERVLLSGKGVDYMVAEINIA
ncbi:PhzF family phenazine biosynthesis protein [Alkalimonas collagenimarina]|uniref:PhzF family phenazine biosynthesis protein n=1 Tax=Alkalimonas collagenimarina TaxID=400390 RepID=A0ABT9H3B8_9GAMM|nr:PhzF family phenazine biosynthesis protein [Alkalimonas collagenimarina]MDP4537793.1 PhzF family phenazine biosynthesis protein [Alkalimonas collagenimarina]